MYGAVLGRHQWHPSPPNFRPSVRKEYESPSEINDFRGAFVRVVRLERTVSWSQRDTEHFFRSFIAVFSSFLFVLLTL